MTNPKQDAPEYPDLDELDKAATSGLWGQFNTGNGPWREDAKTAWRDKNYDVLDTSHHISAMRKNVEPYRVAEFTHSADAAFAEALVNAYRAGRLK